MQTRLSNLSLLSSLAALGGLSLAGCALDERSGDDDDIEVAEQAMTSNEGTAEITSVSMIFAEHADLELANAELQSRVENASCLTIEGEEGAATIEFDGCVGRFGFVSITGTLEVTVDTDGDVVTYDFATDELFLNRVQLSGSWQVVADHENSSRTWEGSMTMIGPHGHEVQTSTSAAWSFDGDCVTYSASSELRGPFGGVRTVEVDEVTRCVGQCPSGGSVTVTFPNGATMSWQYGGDDTAVVTGPRGREFEVLLPCGY
jgi:hypothetical protein